MIIVKIGSVTHNGVSYEIGKEVPGLTAAEEQRLLDLGVCESWEPAVEEAKTEDVNTDPGDKDPGIGNTDPGTKEDPPDLNEGSQEPVNLEFNPDEAIKGKKDK
jgi:hypothetical protein